MLKIKCQTIGEFYFHFFWLFICDAQTVDMCKQQNAIFKMVLLFTFYITYNKTSLKLTKYKHEKDVLVKEFKLLINILSYNLITLLSIIREYSWLIEESYKSE